MKPFQILLACTALFALVSCEPPIGKRPLVFNNWPPKNGKQLARNPGPVGAGSKQRTLVVQIRSDQPVPLVLKGRPGHAHTHSHAHGYTHAHGHNHGHVHSHLIHAQTHVRGPPPSSHHHHPLKLSSAPVYLKATGPVLQSKPVVRKPLKIKLNNISKPKSKPTFGYEKPFKFEKPTTVSYSETQSLPLDTHVNFISDHFSPIYTVPAPNLALHDNQLHDDTTSTYLPPTQSTVQPQTYLPPKPPTTGVNQYQVVEEYETNDQTLSDPISGSQTLFAPDPDPSLPTSKIRPAFEPFNQPSNNKPLPADVQNNHLAPAQPLVQIIGAQAAAQTAPQIYPIQFTQQAALQPLITANVAAVQAAPIPIYNPTYLVTQSNQLYSQHQQQLFKPSVENIIEAGYVNADLTQEVASNGQILQAAKDPHHNIHPVLDVAPQFAALIAGPALGEEHVYETAPFHLANVAAAAGSSAPEGGFVVSNYYSSPQDSSQLLQAYAEEEAQRQRLETEHAQLELQKQHQHLQQLKLQAEEQELRAQEQLHQQQQLQQLQQFQHQQQQQLQLQQLQEQQQQQQRQQHQQQQRQQHHQQQLQQQHQQQELDPAASAFEEHQRLVQQQLGEQPLRIFVPDEEGPEAQRLQKRSDDLKKGTVDDVENTEKDSFEVSTSVEVSGEQQNAASE